MFYYQQDSLFCDSLAISKIAKEFESPFYLYSFGAVENNVRRVRDALKDSCTLYYALKANTNTELVTRIGSLGLGADVVSAGEIAVAINCGIKAANIVFAGVGKRDDEIKLALEKGVRALHAESLQEIEVINSIAQSLERIAPVAIRVNPDIDIDGHPYIATGRAAAKFGIGLSVVMDILRNESRFTNTRIIGFHIHLGSQIFDISHYRKSISLLHELLATASRSGVNIEYIDIGGGLGVDYEAQVPETEQDARETNSPSIDLLRSLASELAGIDCEVIFEPGRCLVANAGILVTRVLYTKETAGKRFTIVDAGMTDLIRPSLYDAYHRITPVERMPERGEAVTDVVGPICETGDFLARERKLQKLQRGDLLAVMTTGAYGYVLSSNYNGRKRPAEVVVDKDSMEMVTPAR